MECSTEIPGIQLLPKTDSLRGRVIRHWRGWLGGTVLLLLISGFVLQEYHRNCVRRLELAANQIVIGSDWRTIWTADKALWYEPVFSTTRDGSLSEEYVYGGPIGHMTSGISWTLYESPLTSRWSGWFHPYARYPVSVVVDQGGQGKVIGVREGLRWRGVRDASATQTPTIKSPPEE